MPNSLLFSLALVFLSATNAPVAARAQSADGFAPFQDAQSLHETETLLTRPPDQKVLQVLPPLPPLSPMTPSRGDRASEESTALTEPALNLQSLEIRGNTAIDDETLSIVAAPWLNRPIGTADLLDLRNALTAHYIEQGYISSGARIPDQVPNRGVLVVEIVEGRLGQIDYSTQTRLDRRFIERRLALDADHPLQLQALERRLRIIQETANLRRIDARIEPGAQPGLDRLVLEIEESDLVDGWAEAGTLTSPNIGGYGGRIGVEVRSLAGWGDQTRLRFNFAEGLTDLGAEFSIPVGPYDTRIGVRGRYGKSRVVAQPVRPSEIETEFISFGFAITQPVWRERDQRIDVGLIGEWGQGTSFLSGARESFSEGAENGRFSVTALRPFVMARFQSPNQIVALLSTFSFGLDLFGATIQPAGIEDGRFMSWLSQVQILRQLKVFPVDVLLRGDVQWASDRLPPIERFVVGGRNSVRGVRENFLARDNGATGSLEVRWPFLRSLKRRRLLEVFTFVDAGHSWTNERDPDNADTVVGAGLGLRASPVPWLDLEVSWARRLTEKLSVLQDDIQDDGLFFRVQIAQF